MSALPSPSPSLPLDAHVDGMNCAMPAAPTELTAFGFHPDSASICAAITGGVIRSQIEPARITSDSYSLGTPLTPVDALALPAMNAPRTDTSTTTTVRITTSNGMRGRLTAPMMDMILAAITRMTRAMALAARTDAFTRCSSRRGRPSRGRVDAAR